MAKAIAAATSANSSGPSGTTQPPADTKKNAEALSANVAQTRWFQDALKLRSGDDYVAGDTDADSGYGLRRLTDELGEVHGQGTRAVQMKPRAAVEVRAQNVGPCR